MEDPIRTANVKLDHAIEQETRLKEELLAAQRAVRLAREATRSARRQRDEAIEQERKANGKTAARTPVQQWLIKNKMVTDPELKRDIKRANWRAKAERRRKRIAADPVLLEHNRRLKREQMQRYREKKRFDRGY